MSIIATAFAQQGRLDEALTIAHTIEDPSSLANTFSNIAATLAQTGRDAQAILDEAFNIAHTTEGINSFRNDILSNSLNSISQTGQLTQFNFDEMFSPLRIVEENNSRASALSNVAVIRAKAGYMPSAFRILHAIEVVNYRISALSMIGIELSQKEKTGKLVLDDALNTAHSVEDPITRAIVLSYIAALLAKEKQSFQTTLDEAFDIVRDLESTSARATVLTNIAIAFVQSNRLDEALGIVRSLEPISSRITALANVAVALVQIGEPSQVILNEALNTARNLETPFECATALNSIATVLVQARQPSQDILDEALHIAKTDASVVVSLVHATILSSLTTALIQTGKFAQAFSKLGLLELSEYLNTISKWHDKFEKIQPNLTFFVFCEAVRVVAWEKPKWKEIHEILVEATKDM